MKVIFLDNDGVICLGNNWGSRFKKIKKSEFQIINDPNLPVDLRFDNFDKGAVGVLNDILLKTGAEIVVSSDWRLRASVEELGDYYQRQGIIKRPIGVTRLFNELDPTKIGKISWSDKWRLEQERYFEILDWLDNHPEVEKWVAIDDLDMSVKGDWGLTNFIHTPKVYEGIKQSGKADKIIKLLI